MSAVYGSRIDEAAFLSASGVPRARWHGVATPLPRPFTRLIEIRPHQRHAASGNGSISLMRRAHRPEFVLYSVKRHATGDGAAGATSYMTLRDDAALAKKLYRLRRRAGDRRLLQSGGMISRSTAHANSASSPMLAATTCGWPRYCHGMPCPAGGHDVRRVEPSAAMMVSHIRITYAHRPARSRHAHRDIRGHGVSVMPANIIRHAPITLSI